MKTFVLPALAAGLLMATAPVASVSAAPVGTIPVAAPKSAVDTVAYSKKRSMKKRMYRTNSGPYAPRNAGNAKNPERPVYQQNQGGTAGGPAR
jgi:hypothetical protein